MSLGIFTDYDLCLTHGIVWAVGLDLVDHPLELHSQIFGERGGFLMGQDEVQVFVFEQGTMGIVAAAWYHGETVVVILAELWQEGIGAGDVRDASQAQLFDQAVLQGLVGAFDASFGLWGIGTNDLDV